MKSLFTLLIGLAMFISCNAQDNGHQKSNDMKKYTVVKTEQEWKESLSAEEYRILREKGTEYPFSGEYNEHFEKGTYSCAACDYKLFDSSHKFKSHCGWPSFDNELGGDRVVRVEDKSLGMKRVEILCGNCGGHLGHIFDDGPTDTGQRYCVNSISIKFTPEKTK